MSERTLNSRLEGLLHFEGLISSPSNIGNDLHHNVSIIPCEHMKTKPKIGRLTMTIVS
jgi:hypothetical protein